MTTYNTPGNIDNYTRFFANLFDENEELKISTGFLTHFGMTPTSQTVFTEDEVTDIDIVRANGEQIANLQKRGSEAQLLGSTSATMLPEKHTNIVRLFPLLEETGTIGATQINKRLPGEAPSGSFSRQERTRRLAKKIYTNLLQRSSRLFEYLAAQTILTGEMPVGGGESLDMYRNSALAFDAATEWNAEGGDPYLDIDTAWDLIREHGKVSADMIVMGDQAIEAFVGNAKVIAYSDNRRYAITWIDDKLTVPSRIAQFADAGMTVRARLVTPRGHELFVLAYTDGYTASGTYTKFMPIDKAYLAYSGARCDRFFGPPERLTMDTQRRQFYRDHLGIDPTSGPMIPGIRGGGSAIDMRMFYFDAYAPPTHKNMTVRIQAAPIFATTMTDAFCVISKAYVAPA